MTFTEWATISDSLFQLGSTVIWVFVVRGFSQMSDRWYKRYVETSNKLWEVQKNYMLLQLKVKLGIKDDDDAQTDKASGPT